MFGFLFGGGCLDGLVVGLIVETLLLPHSAPSWILSLAENLASSILQDGATEWYYSLDGNHKLWRRRLPKFVKNTLPPYQQLGLKFCAVSPPKYEHVIKFSCVVSPPIVSPTSILAKFG